MAGRPEKVGADWFKHYNNMIDDSKTREVISEFGGISYAVLMVILEEICKGKEYKIELKNEKNFTNFCRILSGKLMISRQKFERILTNLVEKKIVILENFCIFSAEINLQMECLEERRKQDRERVRKHRDSKEIGNCNANCNAIVTQLSQNCNSDCNGDVTQQSKSKSIEKEISSVCRQSIVKECL